MPSRERNSTYEERYLSIRQVPVEALPYLGDDLYRPLSCELEEACDASIETAKREIRLLNDGALPPADDQEDECLGLVLPRPNHRPAKTSGGSR